MPLPSRILLVALLSLLGPAALHAADAAEKPPDPPPPPDPQIQVFLERDSLRPGGTSRMEVWILNPSDEALSPVVLHVVAPPFLSVLDGSCKGAPLERDLPLGGMKPHSLLRRHYCLQSGQRVREGEARLTLLVEYGWLRDRRQGIALKSVEKPIQIGLFGTGDVGDVSLGLIALVLPGLLFFQILSWRGVTWAQKLESYPLLTLSIVASVLIQLVTQWRGEDLAGPIELLAACFLAATLAAVIAHFWNVREAKRLRRLDVKVADNDPPATILRKLLSVHPDAKKPKTVLELKDGSRLIGSLGATTETGAVIVGSYWIDRQKIPPEALAEIEEAAGSGNLSQLADLIEQNKVPLKSRYEVQIEGKDGESKSLTGPVRRSRDEVRDLRYSAAGGLSPALELPKNTLAGHEDRLKQIPPGGG